jgi:hypothetical protein
MLDVSPVSFVCRLRQHARIHLLIPSDMKGFTAPHARRRILVPFLAAVRSVELTDDLHLRVRP